MDDYTDYKKISAPQDLDDLIARLHEVFSKDHVNVEYVRTLMTLYKSNQREWRKYAKFDPHRYTRNLIDSGNGKFNLIALCWGEGHGSSIHSHSDSHCFAKVLQGEVKETMFEWPPEGEDNEMTKISERTWGKNNVMYINDSMGLHRVENPSTIDQAVTLHLYSPPFDLCNCFDQKSGTKTTSRVTFWSKYGEKTVFSNWFRLDDSEERKRLKEKDNAVDFSNIVENN